LSPADEVEAKIVCRAIAIAIVDLDLPIDDEPRLIQALVGHGFLAREVFAHLTAAIEQARGGR
jgi:hypothetical protein